MEERYQVDVYLPKRVHEHPTLIPLRKEWSSSFGGTTCLSGVGTYALEPEETVFILRLYVPATFAKAEVIHYFQGLRKTLEQNFQDEEEFLIVFSEGHVFI